MLASLICMEPPIGCGLAQSSQRYGILTGTSEKYPQRPCSSHGQFAGWKVRELNGRSSRNEDAERKGGKVLITEGRTRRSGKVKDPHVLTRSRRSQDLPSSRVTKERGAQRCCGCQ